MLRRAWRAAVALLAAVGFLVLFVTVTPLVEWWGRRLGDVWADSKGDTLIVLGGSMLDHGVIGVSSYWRSVYAARAYHDDGFRRIIVSGGPAGDPTTPVSAAMRDFLICEGVPAEVITIEAESDSTRENAVRTARLLEGDTSRKVLLTSDYHMYRASRAFAKAGIRVAPRPFPDVVKMAQRYEGRWPGFLMLCLETAKIGYYRLRGWI